MVFQWSLNDSKSPQVSRTLLSILSNVNNAVVWIVSTRPHISCGRNNPLLTVPSTPITIGITVIFMFHSFFCSLARSWYLSLFLLSFSYYYYHYYLLIRVSHIRVSWWFFTGVWVTASLLKSPGLFSVFCPSSIMLSFGWSPLVRQLPNPSGPFNYPLVTVPKAPITIGTFDTFMFHSFFNSLARLLLLLIFLLSYATFS